MIKYTYKICHLKSIFSIRFSGLTCIHNTVQLHCSFQNPFPNRNPIPTKQWLPLLHSPNSWLPLTDFQPLWICLCWIVHVNSVMECLSFGIWPVSLSVLSSRLIHVVTNFRTSFLLMVGCLYNIDPIQFICPFLQPLIDRLFPPCTFMNSTVTNIHTQISIWISGFNLLCLM